MTSLKKITIQEVASILASQGKRLKPQQPRLERGRFVAQYEVDGKIYTARELFKAFCEQILHKNNIAVK